MNAVRGLGEASALDEKTHTLAYVAVLAALRLESGVRFHVEHARVADASRDEVISAGPRRPSRGRQPGARVLPADVRVSWGGVVTVVGPSGIPLPADPFPEPSSRSR